MSDLDPSALIVGLIASAVYPELFISVTSGGLLDPSTNDNKFEALNAFSSISIIPNVLFL